MKQSIQRAILFSALLVLSATSAFPWQTDANIPRTIERIHAGPEGRIDFPDNLVPRVTTALPLLKLTPQKAPVNFMREMLGKLGVKAESIQPLARLSQTAPETPKSLQGVMEENRLRAYWNEQSGDAEIFPALSGEKTETFSEQNLQLKRATSIAAAIFARPDIIKKDATQVSIGEPHPLLGTTAEHTADREATSSERLLYLTYVPIWRKVNGYQVYGPGSRGLVAVGNDGSIQGFLRRWKSAAFAGQTREVRSPQQVRSDILKQLAPLAREADVSVLSVEIAYYDDDKSFIWPTYRVTAKVHDLPQPASGVEPGKNAVNDNFIVRYLPIGSQSPVAFLKPLAAADPLPQMPRNDAGPQALTIPPGDPTIGRYVVRNDDPNWVANANEFWGGLTSFAGGSLFTDAQYFWAEPWEFTSNEGSFVNSVQVAENEVHGNWWYFTTYKNYGDGVSLTSIPATGGYGSSNHGKLDYWILHSCEVVPSAMDAPCSSDSRPWWTPWFNIFQGLHSVLGYRTIMYIDDDVTGPFATNLRLGAPVVSAWFNSTLSAPDYASHPTYTAHCGKALPMGKPSTISSCGHQNDSVFNTAPLPAANCLINFWQP
ncbi:MAG TPA: DUF6345 domain-containing protein [Candidatus Angelobacter sp.]|nr:DUF6345 domain-containing protein [Candidatus Angelobacter sp.]